MEDMDIDVSAKSDQLNAIDLLNGPLTVKITKVLERGKKIHYDGCNGKPWHTCKTTRRILADGWGGKGKDFVGRSVTLYRKPEVVYAGEEVGGIRISHMSDIGKEFRISLSETRGKKTLYIIKVLTVEKPIEKKSITDSELEELSLKIGVSENLEDLKAIKKTIKGFDADSLKKIGEIYTKKESTLTTKQE